MILKDTPAFVPFIGTVEDTENDPKQLGRVKVRVFNHHDNLDVEDLDWMTVGLPTTSASKAGVGTSPTWLEVGSIVFGFYFDGTHRNTPIIIGTLPVIQNNDESLHAVHRLARGQQDATNTNPEGGPDIIGSPQYPHNKVIQTPAGHRIEIDDSPGSNRIVIRHASGSVAAINSDGDIVFHSVNDSYHLVSGNLKEKVEGDISTEGGSVKIKSKGKMVLESSGATEVKSTGKVTITAPNVDIQ